MARAARVIGAGGVLGWLLPETIGFPSESEPMLANIQILYMVSGASQDTCNLVFMTNGTPSEIRTAAKIAIQDDILAKTGVTVPRAQIKMLNSPE